MSAGIVYELDGPTVAQAASASLTRRGLFVVRSFDLRSALAAHAECECPHHGTAQCTCSFVVLLIYGAAPQPLVLTMHCRDERTQAQIVEEAGALPDPRLSQEVRDVLEELWRTLPPSRRPLVAWREP